MNEDFGRPIVFQVYRLNEQLPEEIKGTFVQHLDLILVVVQDQDGERYIAPRKRVRFTDIDS
jgi:hypothetical protein